jgi:hypothetical protein
MEQDDARDDREDGDAERDERIRALVARLARPHPSGARVIERATLLAEGADFRAVITWIEARGGRPEAVKPSRAPRGLHSARTAGDDRSAAPLRYLVPAGACAGPASSTPSTPGDPR